MTVQPNRSRYGAQPLKTHQGGGVPGLVPRQDPPTATGGRLAPPREGTRQRVSRLKATGTQQKNSFRIGTWNVRTMTPGISEDLRTIKDSRKTAVINNELLRLQIDIAAIQETRLADTAALAGYVKRITPSSGKERK